MKAIVNEDACIGCGLCVNLCEEVFEMQGDKAVVKGSSVSKEAEAGCQQAVSDCPVNAIEIQ